MKTTEEFNKALSERIVGLAKAGTITYEDRKHYIIKTAEGHVIGVKARVSNQFKAEIQVIVNDRVYHEDEIDDEIISLFVKLGDMEHTQRSDAAESVRALAKELLGGY